MRSGAPLLSLAAFSFQSRSTSRAIAAGVAPGPTRSLAICHSVSPGATTWRPPGDDFVRAAGGLTPPRATGASGVRPATGSTGAVLGAGVIGAALSAEPVLSTKRFGLGVRGFLGVALEVCRRPPSDRAPPHGNFGSGPATRGRFGRAGRAIGAPA